MVTITSTAGNEYKFDATGFFVFVVATVLFPVTLLIFGFSLVSVLTGAIALVGLVHLVACFFHLVWVISKKDLTEMKSEEKARKDASQD